MLPLIYLYFKLKNILLLYTVDEHKRKNYFHPLLVSLGMKWVVKRAKV